MGRRLSASARRFGSSTVPRGALGTRPGEERVLTKGLCPGGQRFADVALRPITQACEQTSAACRPSLDGWGDEAGSAFQPSRRPVRCEPSCRPAGDRDSNAGGDPPTPSDADVALDCCVPCYLTS